MHTNSGWHYDTDYQVTPNTESTEQGGRLEVADISLNYLMLKFVCSIRCRPRMTSSNRNILRITGHLCGEFVGPLWIPRTKASDAELWFFYDLRYNYQWPVLIIYINRFFMLSNINSPWHSILLWRSTKRFIAYCNISTNWIYFVTKIAKNLKKSNILQGKKVIITAVICARVEDQLDEIIMNNWVIFCCSLFVAFVCLNCDVQCYTAPSRCSIALHPTIYCTRADLLAELNTLRRKQDGRHFPDDIFKCNFLNENVWTPIKISMNFDPKGRIDDIPNIPCRIISLNQVALQQRKVLYRTKRHSDVSYSTIILSCKWCVHKIALPQQQPVYRLETLISHSRLLCSS